MESFYRMLRRVGSDVVNRDSHYYEKLSESGMAMLARGMKRGGELTPEVRVSFAAAFGITVQAQLLLEAYYDNHDPIWVHPSPEQSIPDKLIRPTYTGDTSGLYLETSLWTRDLNLYPTGQRVSTRGSA